MVAARETVGLKFLTPCWLRPLCDRSILAACRTRWQRPRGPPSMNARYS